MWHFGARRGVYRVLVWKPEEKRPLKRHRHRWEVILKWILNWMGSKYTVMEIWFP